MRHIPNSLHRCRGNGCCAALRHAGNAGRRLCRRQCRRRRSGLHAQYRTDQSRFRSEGADECRGRRPIPTPAEARAQRQLMPNLDQPRVRTTRCQRECHDRRGFTMATFRPPRSARPGKPCRRNSPNATTRSTECRSWRCRSAERSGPPAHLSCGDGGQTAAAKDAARLAPAVELNVNQALNETHPLPASVRAIRGVRGLDYVKTKSKVFLVEPATRIVIAEISS